MKMKTQLSLGSIIAAGLLASGCSQMSGQQVAQAAPVAAAPAPEVRTIVDCSKCARPAASKPRPAANKPSPRARPRPVAKRPAPVRRAPPAVVRHAPIRRAPAANRWAHTHPAIPGCTNSITHSHQYNRANHTHRYSCRNGQRQQHAVQRPTRPAVNKWAHTHPAVPGCTNSVTHNHAYNNANHSHRYSCRGGYRQPQVKQHYQPMMPAMPVMPKVKAKGTYRGPIKIDGGVMQQYQQ